ncbi:mannose-1-phosphate guanyltransferase alpha-A [Venturia canescens]|uniref:mannose-1-phosphate guanyltransferase alpha-A n=1 Tax=Venturia canescens TaxID=32260 RepID=UPI001C9CDED0|nr:mannose-1-phosphate guanyltransferase alpha-A [Venturia canescens]XP_043277782.1 mannose-1-phosphate guanyltransferase alpha-A [Venturia canescens]XP_043277783.1 mannose-1-phosphate guanyltransferase alpha-A [Venturia canescens]XP_043277784.1 mannose-1-phosphate guanyltransferase alpha-A [Venturia canescens]
MIKAVILIGGPLKGTRFRPLSLDIPKPLFPVAGLPMIEHHIEACTKIPGLSEVFIIGSYAANDLHQFVQEMAKKYTTTIRYLQEFTPLGTAGGLYHFRDQIRAGSPDHFFVMNGDVCADFPLREILESHRESKALITIMSTEATRQQSLNYGCLVMAKDGKVSHYVEKPSTFVSTLINCGVYVISPEIFPTMAEIFYARNQQDNLSQANGNGKDPAHIALEQDVLTRLAGTGKLNAVLVKNWWSQVKTAGSAIYSNRHYLALYREKYPERLALSSIGVCNVVGDVCIHPTAVVHPSAVLGPNVSIGPCARIEAGVRIRESIVLADAQIQAHSIVLHSIVGRSSTIGEWARVEGTPCDPNPNKPFAKMENPPLFNVNGKLNPSITILGTSVSLASGKILLNSIVLPHKELTRNFKNEIIL